MNKLIEEIMRSDLSDEKKETLVLRVANASHGIDNTIVPGFYLRSEKIGNINEMDMQLWYRNVDESGMTNHGPTGYDTKAIFEFMKENCLDKEQTHKL